MGVEHYENFPVASWLCPAPLRPAVQALYHFARTADDLADEGEAPAEARRASLARYRRALAAALAGAPATDARAWPEVFGPLAQAAAAHRLPAAPLHALLDAFEQDTHNALFADEQALRDYCSRSANPVGRLMLHLVGVDDPQSLRESDAICTALQLINFWQDCSVDHPRGRIYVPVRWAERHGLDAAEAAQWQPQQAGVAALLKELHAWAAREMAAGQALAARLPGRFGWELAFVVAGGQQTLQRVRALGARSLLERPTLGWRDAPALLRRALTIRAGSAASLAAPGAR